MANLPSGPMVLSQGAQMVMNNGKTLVKTEAGYHTAITVQKPRNLTMIEQAVLNEAAFAEDDFFYQWIINGKDGKREVVQGGTISLALCMAREWTNTVVKVDVEEKDGSWFFKGSFIDLERGSTVERLFRKTIPRTSTGKYEGDRWVDMMFQKAQSQALRNVIFSALPRWLRDKAVERARDAALHNIETYGLDKAKEMILLPLVKLGATTPQIEAYLGKSHEEWDKEDLLLLRNLVVQIRNGEVTLEEVLSAGQKAKANSEPKATQKEPPKAQTSAQAAAPQGTSPQPSQKTGTATTGQTQQPSTASGFTSNNPNTNRVTDLYNLFFRFGFKELTEQYKQYLKEKYGSDALIEEQIAEQEKILNSCKKFEVRKKFEVLLKSKNVSPQSKQAEPANQSDQAGESNPGSKPNQPGPTKEDQGQSSFSAAPEPSPESSDDVATGEPSQSDNEFSLF